MLDDSVEQDELEEFRRRWKQEVEAKKFVKNSSVQPQLPKPKAFRPSTTSVLESHSAEPDDPPKRDRDSPVVGQKTSLEYYMTAIEKEKVGNLSEALTNYRHAFKLDPDADDSYRQHWQQHIAPHAAATSAAVQSSSTVKHEDDFERHVHLGDDYEKPNGLAPNDTLENLLAQLRGMQLECTPLKEDKPIFIAMLPSERRIFC
ncbi:hypothetical protein BC938DRAFT_479339 [Jimgerdemannia flammicorona]|uniref:Uncharacterized protein n=1 Tax=Jimgerdemannia flammicorona TaxID=994334 RepID=A0A433QXW7_9FUNG|nr:hypothetical protein BC938DRAFT_479339 [Jimgerdemannia flammicorona]